MSAVPIREAIHQLDALGLVEQIPHRGTYVRQVSRRDLQDVYQARLALEPFTVGVAANLFTADDADEAAQGLHAAQDAEISSDPVGSRLGDADFHFALYRAARSDWLLRLITPLWQTSERYRSLSEQRIVRDPNARRLEHERVLQACIDHDTFEAARALHAHLAESANSLARALDGNDLFVLGEPFVLLAHDGSSVPAIGQRRQPA
jgi:DNA-binding GntR family transcriptional regulator